MSAEVDKYVLAIASFSAWMDPERVYGGVTLITTDMETGDQRSVELDADETSSFTRFLATVRARIQEEDHK